MNAVTPPLPPGAPENVSSAQPPGKRSIDALRGDRQPPDPNARARPATNGQQVVPELSLPSISVGFGNLQSWEFTQRVARALASSTMVPPQYRLQVARPGRRDEMIDNPNAIPNCIVALNIANRVREDVLMVMQNMHVIEGRPSWGASYIIGRVNSCGEFTRLKFRFEDRGKKTVAYTVYEWNEAERKKMPRSINEEIHDIACTAYATEKATGEMLEGDAVSIEMAVQEGWYSKNGSKWRTMATTMLRYRSGSFFARANCPDILMGMRTADEEDDFLNAAQADDGEWQVTNDVEGEAVKQDDATPVGTHQDVRQQIEHEQTIPIDLGAKDNEPVEATRKEEASGPGDRGEDQPSDNEKLPDPADDKASRGAGAPKRRAPELDLAGSGFGSVN